MVLEAAQLQAVETPLKTEDAKFLLGNSNLACQCLVSSSLFLRKVRENAVLDYPDLFGDWI